MKMTLEVDAQPQGRIRFSRGRCYYSPKDMQYRKSVREQAKAAMAGKEPMTGEICAAVKIYRKYKNSARQFGDVDNHLKAIFDALNGVCYVDDAQIVRAVVEKHTDKARPRVEIELGAIEIGKNRQNLNENEIQLRTYRLNDN